MFASVCDEPLLRALAAGALVTLVVVVFGPAMIVFLRRRCAEPVRSDSTRLESLHRGKDGTPTMGGLLLVGGIILGVIACGDLRQPGVLLALAAMLGMAVVGAVDDLIKLRTRRSGLGWRGKLLGQVIVAAIPAICFYAGWCEPDDASFLPGVFCLTESWGIVPWTLLVLIATTNAVNITDGLDGLATGCLALAALALTIVMYFNGTAASGELMVIAAAMVGALLGFLPFNLHPARVFMGNVGSLALGGLLGGLALASGTDSWLPFVGGVFVAEAVSVILQIGSFKLFRKRLLLCAPLHHHFEFHGWPEVKVVRRFWLAAAICAVSGVMLCLAGMAFEQSFAEAKMAMMNPRSSAADREIRVGELPLLTR
ncbi:MAG TPA: phospho-N-acetylmuramoyl-pentapeptide-transferase [Pirellulales bacterium]|jgi:phospho-N-acetylmuramoyl-pentapeptide-transferase